MTLDYALGSEDFDCVLNAGGDTDTAGSYMGATPLRGRRCPWS